MTQQPLFILRQSPDWHSLSADFKAGKKIDPVRFRPPEPVPAFPNRIAEFIGAWNARMGVDFFTCRSRLKDMCDDSIAQIPGARRVSYRDAAAIGPDIKNYIAFFHDDDDWFAPDLLDVLRETMPEKYQVCVYPLVRIAEKTETLMPFAEPPPFVVGMPHPFTHRYQSNNYGLNGEICDKNTLIAMKDHIQASNFASREGLRDTYISRFISATAKTPCSAQTLAKMFRDPDKARNDVERYVKALKQLRVSKELPWIQSRVEKLADLFAEVLGDAPKAAATLPAEPAAPVVVKAAAPAPAPVVSAPAIPAPAIPAPVGKPAPALKPSPAAARAKPSLLAGLGKAANALVQKGKPNPPKPPPRHEGVQYLEFIKFIGEVAAPSSYFEIGTQTGNSVSRIQCDAVCVDPNFIVSVDVLKKRRRALFFQMTSDEFFTEYDLKQFFPQGPDLAFLDGMHQFDFLLRDFINAEKLCHKNSIILLHDCLPFSKNITARIQTPGPWAGDVWKMLPILKKYRPDLKVYLFDCPPTGLVACTGLDPNSSVLFEAYDRIVADFINVTDLPANLQTMYPRMNTNQLVADPEKMKKILFRL
jgi:hypothetical protein